MIDNASPVKKQRRDNDEVAAQLLKIHRWIQKWIESRKKLNPLKQLSEAFGLISICTQCLYCEGIFRQTHGAGARTPSFHSPPSSSVSSMWFPFVRLVGRPIRSDHLNFVDARKAELTKISNAILEDDFKSWNWTMRIRESIASRGNYFQRDKVVVHDSNE